MPRNADSLKAITRVTTSCRACLMILDKRGSGFPVIFLPLLALCSRYHWTVVHLRRSKARPLSFSHLYFCARPNVPSVTCEQSWGLESCSRKRGCRALRELFSSQLGPASSWLKHFPRILVIKQIVLQRDPHGPRAQNLSLDCMCWSGLECGTEGTHVNEFLKMWVKGSHMLKRKHSVWRIIISCWVKELILGTV